MSTIEYHVSHKITGEHKPLDNC